MRIFCVTIYVHIEDQLFSKEKKKKLNNYLSLFLSLFLFSLSKYKNKQIFLKKLVVKSFCFFHAKILCRWDIRELQQQ